MSKHLSNKIILNMYISEREREGASQNMYRPKASLTQELPIKCAGTREHPKKIANKNVFVENWAHYVYPTQNI